MWKWLKKLFTFSKKAPSYDAYETVQEKLVQQELAMLRRFVSEPAIAVKVELAPVTYVPVRKERDLKAEGRAWIENCRQVEELNRRLRERGLAA